MSKSMYYAGGYSYPVLWGDGSLYTGHAKGISRLSFDEDAGVFQLEGVQEPVLNPSYLIMNAAGTRLYCVNELDCFNETEGGAVSAYRADSEGGLVLMGQAATLGASPCHLQLAPDESFLCVSNYNGGSLRVLPLGADGTFGGQGTLIQHTGRGVNALRQEKPHVHSLVFSPDGQWAVMADLGLDQLCIHRVSGGGLHQEPLRILHTPVGSGPRVARYHPRKSVLYCVCELSNTVLVYEGELSEKEPLQCLSTLPQGNPVASTAADILLSPEGSHLYVSNRGHNSITTFAVEDTGRLAYLDNVSCHGDEPRSLQLSETGKWLFACNQNSDSVAVFALQNGLPRFQASFSLPTPTCLCPAGTRGRA